MIAVRHTRLAAIAGASCALLMLTCPARAHANMTARSSILTFAPVASHGWRALRGLDLGGAGRAPLRSARIDGDWTWNHHDHGWNPGDDWGWKWSGGDHDGSPSDHHDKKELPEPGTFGLYVSALLGGAFFLRARKSRSR